MKSIIRQYILSYNRLSRIIKFFVTVVELCRIVAEEKINEINPNAKSSEINFNFTLNDFIYMANRQNKEEFELEKQANKILFCDNDSFALTIWTERYLGKYYNEIYDIYANANYLNNHNKIYILTKPNVPFVQDGLRDGEFIRDWMYNRFIQELDNKKYKYFIIDSPNFEERLAKVLDIVENNI